MNYFRADEGPRVARSQRRYDEPQTRRPAPQTRQDLRATPGPRRGQYTEIAEEEYEDEQVYVRRPATRLQYAQQPVQMRQKRPVRQELVYEKEPDFATVSRRSLLGKALTWGGATAATALGIALTVNDVTANQQLSADTAKYGNNLPPTYYTTAAVGHNNDSSAKPSHFTAQNQDGYVIIFELPAGDTTKAVIMTGMVLMGSEKSSIPVSLNFVDTTGNGRLDMQVTAGGQTLTWLNTGAKFNPPANPGLNVNG